MPENFLKIILNIIFSYIKMIIYTPWIILTFSWYIILLLIYDINLTDYIFKYLFILLDNTYYFWLDLEDNLNLNWRDIVWIFFYYLFFITLIFNLIKSLLKFLFKGYIDNFKFPFNKQLFLVILLNVQFLFWIILIIFWYWDFWIQESKVFFILFLFLIMIINIFLIFLYNIKIERYIKKD